MSPSPLSLSLSPLPHLQRGQARRQPGLPLGVPLGARVAEDGDDRVRKGGGVEGDRDVALARLDVDAPERIEEGGGGGGGKGEGESEAPNRGGRRGGAAPSTSPSVPLSLSLAPYSRQRGLLLFRAEGRQKEGEGGGVRSGGGGGDKKKTARPPPQTRPFSTPGSGACRGRGQPHKKQRVRTPWRRRTRRQAGTVKEKTRCVFSVDCSRIHFPPSFFR